MTQHVQDPPRFHVGRITFEQLDTSRGRVWVAHPDREYGQDRGVFLPTNGLPRHPERTTRYQWHREAVMTLALAELCYHAAGRSSRGHYVIRDERFAAVCAVLADLRVRVERLYR